VIAAITVYLRMIGDNRFTKRNLTSDSLKDRTMTPLLQNPKIRRLAVLLGLIVYPVFMAPPVQAGNSAVIFMYHRFGEGDYPSTSITIDQFTAHIAELKSGGYHVMSVPDIVSALKNKTALPDRAVGITVDDAYLSVFREAWPRLKAAGFPFTLFVATDPIDRNIKGYMSWQQIRQLQSEGVTIGSQTASHLHMAGSSEADIRRDLEHSGTRFKEEIGAVPDLIAYPYGEAGSAVMALARQSGFGAGFGQHSGVAGLYSNTYYLPRFALNERYGDMDRFHLAANALDLPVADLTPADPRIGSADDNPPAIGFTLLAAPLGGSKGVGNLSCFVSHEGAASITTLGGEDGGNVRIEVRMNKPMPAGRTRLNCTLPAGDGRWRWFGQQFFVDK